MALYRVTVTRTVASNGLRLEPGMYVDIPTQTTTNPVSVNGGREVIAAFQRIYGIDVTKSFGILRTALSVEKIG